MENSERTIENMLIELGFGETLVTFQAELKKRREFSGIGLSNADQTFIERKDGTWGCLLCSKRFTTKGSAKRHTISMHSSESKQFECPRCCSRFARRDDLYNHLRRIHSAEELVQEMIASHKAENKVRGRKRVLSESHLDDMEHSENKDIDESQNNSSPKKTERTSESSDIGISGAGPEGFGLEFRAEQQNAFQERTSNDFMVPLQELPLNRETSLGSIAATGINTESDQSAFSNKEQSAFNSNNEDKCLSGSGQSYISDFSQNELMCPPLTDPEGGEQSNESSRVSYPQESAPLPYFNLSCEMNPLMEQECEPKQEQQPLQNQQLQFSPEASQFSTNEVLQIPQQDFPQLQQQEFQQQLSHQEFSQLQQQEYSQLQQQEFSQQLDHQDFSQQPQQRISRKLDQEFSQASQEFSHQVTQQGFSQPPQQEHLQPSLSSKCNLRCKSYSSNGFSTILSLLTE